MFDRVTFDPAVMGGRACIRGMRITVALVVNLVTNGMSRKRLSASTTNWHPRTCGSPSNRLPRSRTRKSGFSRAQPREIPGRHGASLTTVGALRAADRDAFPLAGEGLLRLPDPEIVAKALAETRIVLTIGPRRWSHPGNRAKRGAKRGSSFGSEIKTPATLCIAALCRSTSPW